MWPIATSTIALIVSLGACSGAGEPLACNPEVTATCSPLYPPTFDNVYSMTLMSKCGSGARSCHSDAGMKGGMTFSTIDNAYASLLAAGADRVIPGDPSCSAMIIRTTSTDFSIKMPPGSSLIAAEQCALIQWVAQGALRAPPPPAAAAAHAEATW